MALRKSLLGLLLLTLHATGSLTYGQSTEPPLQEAPLSSTPVTPQQIMGGANAQPYTLSVTAREIVVEVVATDRHGRPVPDLKLNEFQVFELGEHSKKTPQRISAIHTINPGNKPAHEAASANPWVTLGRTCAMQNTSYYVLAYHASSQGLTSGYHDILVTTTRDHITLSFRHRYYVGATAPLAKPQFRNASEASAALQRDVCFHPDMPSSLAISARAIPTGNTTSLQYVVLVQSDTLAFTSLVEGPKRIQFDYGICTLDASGTPVRYMQTTADRVLDDEEYAQTLAHGFGNLLGFPRKGNPVYARFVVRDRQTGNIGVTGVPVPPIQAELTQPGAAATGGGATHAKDGGILTSSFGITIPTPGAFCGDVYELTDMKPMLPDLWQLEPVGAIYAYALNVPDQLILGTIGIPGVTNRNSWFAIDYFAEFWVTQPGTFQFELNSDDGSKLFIDDAPVINVDGVHPQMGGAGRVQLNAGRHTIHVPYFQGPPRSVALMLWVKPPGGKSKPFDLRDFAPPAGDKQSSF